MLLRFGDQRHIAASVHQRMPSFTHTHVEESRYAVSVFLPAQDDTGHLREVGLQDRKEELYMVRVEVQGFEGLVVEGMQQLLRRKQVGPRPAKPLTSGLQDGRIARWPMMYHLLHWPCAHRTLAAEESGQVKWHG